MKKILLMDDEPDILEFFGRTLKREGFEVATAATGTECLNLAKKECFDLFLLDISMPDIDGGEVANLLANDKNTASVPIIFISAMVRREDEGNIKGRLFLSKSGSHIDFVKKIKEVMGVE